MKKWLATLVTCLLLLGVSSGVALAHDSHRDRRDHHRHNSRHHYYDHHRDWRHHDGRIIIRANIADDVSLVWAVPVD